MIEKIHINNFKKYQNKEFHLSNHNVLIGGNDAGKSTILQALDIFFNFDKINPNLIPDLSQSVSIGVLFKSASGEYNYVKKIYKGKTFKLDEDNIVGNVNLFSNIKYIYISPNTIDVKKMISDLSLAKTISNLETSIVETMIATANASINDVINNINQDILVVPENTNFVGNSSLKLDSAFKFDIKSEGVPIEGRGNGYQKNIIYSLLINNQFENVIIALDEIENSFSTNNVKSLLSIIQQNYLQTIITTHSVEVAKVTNEKHLLPIYSENQYSLIDIYKNLSCLDGSDIYVLVEGKTDISWIRKCIDLLNLEGNYIIIPCGGHDNITPVKTQLEAVNCICKVIKDGDSNDRVNSISKECIELYCPLDFYNSLFSVNETTIPSTKKDFFEKVVSEDRGIGKDTVKKRISEHVDDFLNASNDLVNEIRTILIN